MGTVHRFGRPPIRHDIDGIPTIPAPRRDRVRVLVDVFCNVIAVAVLIAFIVLVGLIAAGYADLWSASR